MNSDILADHAPLYEQVAAQSDVYSALTVLCRYFGIGNATYNMAQSAGNQFDYPFVRTTYGADWMQRYLAQNYVQIDPVFLEGFKRTQPFFWDELEIASPKVQAFFDDAAGYGITRSGFSVPLVDRVGRRAFFSINDSRDIEAWKEWVKALKPVLVEMADRLHDKALQEMQIGNNKAPLSPREIECLSWVARGKDASMISEILEISEFTVRDYLKAARVKLGCSTIAQAVYEASRLRLINL